MKLLKSEFFQCVGGLNITLTYGTKNSGRTFCSGLCSIRTRYVSFPKERIKTYFCPIKSMLFSTGIKAPPGSRPPPGGKKFPDGFAQALITRICGLKAEGQRFPYNSFNGL